MRIVHQVSCALVCLWLLAATARAEQRTLVVAADGSGQFNTLQAAIDAVPDPNDSPVLIRIKPGTYKQRIVVPKGKRFITIRGEGQDPSAVLITYDLHAKSILPPSTQPVGTTGSTSTLINADDFTAENVTFENPSGHIAQAVAVKTNGDRIIFRNCRFLGGQDTLYPNGHRTYFKDCYIEGRVDFIFGRAVAVFENCHIHSKNGGYVTAASTPQERPFGFVFINCKLTGEGEKAFLGRPWKPYAAVAFIKCELGDHIRPEGWDNWRNPENEKTARYVEYKNTGPGADRSRRVAWSRELTDDEAAAYTVSNILGGADGWDPTR
jgi:pectinesterase